MNIETEVSAFQPQDQNEQMAKEELLADWRQYGEKLLSREKTDIHVTVSAFILNPAMTHTLMAHHLIYDSFAWTGGHADGETELPAVALREAREETGISELWLFSGRILSIDRLPVPAHKRRGKKVEAHFHYSVAYGLIAPDGQPLKVKPDENCAVEWVAQSELEAKCREKEMLPVYRKLWARMSSIRQEKQALYSRLPGLLLPWYKTHSRALPWREDREPYHVWLSEIMLQQTRVEAVKEYYERFLIALPTISALAEAEEGKLLKLWEGLGYYTRARNLQKAAKIVMERYRGRFPETYEQILSLPGVGEYTAGAIASICFEIPVAAVDGNVLRVLSRVTESFEPIDRPSLKREMAGALQAVYPAGECGDFTQSLMELGATVCLPHGAPKCAICPLSSFCMAFGSGAARQLPFKKPKKARRKEKRTVFVFLNAGCIAVRIRKDKGLLAGCWELPNVPGHLNETEAALTASREAVFPTSMHCALQKTHVFTHIEWDMRCYVFSCEKRPPQFTWATESQLREEIALPTAFKMFLQDKLLEPFLR